MSRRKAVQKLRSAPSPLQDIIHQCDQHYWKNLLYINNFRPSKIEDSCMSWTWYLANDLQFSFLAPVFVTLYRYSTPAGVAVTAAVLLVSLRFNYLYYFGAIVKVCCGLGRSDCSRSAPQPCPSGGPLQPTAFLHPPGALPVRTRYLSGSLRVTECEACQCWRGLD